ncbi:MAG TPA: NADH-dependent [FeFe] hydrogenase, group A6 [Clostridia bacterium]|jgi:NADP-reducing hydrogenase subunit HndD|nr:NADH-dependent [FeFe] hydrogenase, group A6 [Clostridia bacterium]
MAGKMINLKINGIDVQVEAGTTILEAARKVGIRIPTLCYLKDINAIGACRVCVVEVKGARSLVASCVYPVSEGMEVTTNSPRVLNSRKKTVELLLSDHDKKCLSCVRSGNCELQTLANEFGCDDVKFKGEVNNFELDESTPYLVRDNNKCILCRRCVAACKQYQSVAVIGANARGFKTNIGSEFSKPLMEIACVGCGQCINVCPTGALRERDEIDEVFAAINDPSKVVIVGTAPSVRVGLGEEFGNPIGTNVEGKMVAALKKLGFDWVFDVNVTADLTILEEGTEFIGRVLNGGKLPMITSCSPGWIKYIEHYYPDYLAHLSSCKSPQQMFGAVCKTYFAEKMGLDPKNIVVVSIMPCTAKKFEKTRPYQDAAGKGIQDVDYALTSRELARFIKRQGIMFNELKDEEFDAPMGIASGAGLIFGATGGVMEAALRTVYEVLEKKELKNLDFEAVRGTEGIKEAVIPVHVNGKLVDVKVAAVSGLANAKIIMEKIKNGEADYHFIEVMACPGGCVNGGGQPIQPADVRNNVDIRKIRAAMLYETDKSMALRKSHESPVVKELYDTYFGEPGSEKSHHILHTKYVARGK